MGPLTCLRILCLSVERRLLHFGTHALDEIKTERTHSLGPVLTRMITCFQFDYIFFIQFNLQLIGRKVNLQAVIFKRIKVDSKSSWTSSFDLFVQFGEFVQLDVACPRNASKPRKLLPSRRLLQGRDSSISRGRATGAAAARGPTAPILSTE